MFGLLELSKDGRHGGVEEFHGMPVLRVCADPAGMFGTGRLRRAGRTLRRAGVSRTLLPREFTRWEVLERLGLRRVDTGPFLRAQAAGLALAALERREIAPDRATVALVGPRTEQGMVRAAMELCPRVRRLVVAAPDGDGLAQKLREEFGVPILPPDRPAQLELRFRPGGTKGEGIQLELYGDRPDLDGGRLWIQGVEAGEMEELPLLSALWEWGKLDLQGLKFT